jgi:hypothetical protein
MVVSFNDSVEVLSELTSDTAKLNSAIRSIKSGEYTQIYEAVYTAVGKSSETLTAARL